MAKNTTRTYGKTIPAELRWLRSVGEGELIAVAMYSPNRLRQLVQVGGLVATDDPGLYRVGAITEEVIAVAER